MDFHRNTNCAVNSSYLLVNLQTVWKTSFVRVTRMRYMTSKDKRYPRYLHFARRFSKWCVLLDSDFCSVLKRINGAVTREVIVILKPSKIIKCGSRMNLKQLLIGYMDRQCFQASTPQLSHTLVSCAAVCIHYRHYCELSNLDVLPLQPPLLVG